MILLNFLRHMFGDKILIELKGKMICMDVDMLFVHGIIYDALHHCIQKTVLLT